MNAKYFHKKEILPAVAGILLSIFTIVWYGFMNPYISIFYREQSQMFLFDSDYFMQYMSMPGGTTAYFASFLIQFFRFRWIGILVYLCIFLSFYIVTKEIFKKFSIFNHSFIIAFIPALLFLPASINMLFDPADELGVIVALCGFLALTKLTENRFYYILIPLSITAIFIISGGNVLITVALYTLYSLFILPSKKLKYAATGLLSFIIPIAVWYFYYLFSFKAACFSLTPFRYPDGALFEPRGIAWWSIIAVTLTGMLLKKIKAGKKWILILNTGIAILLLVHIVKQLKPDYENNVKMGFYAENHQWEDIIKTNKKTSINSQSCYYTNLALQQTGQMAEKMFHYNQIGVSGLFLELKDHFSCYARSELFFQLGWINMAQHSVYESMSGYSFLKEPNVRNIKRLYDCAVIQQKNDLAQKYGKMLSKTLFYRNYVKSHATSADYPPALEMKNSLVLKIPDALEDILENNSSNQAVFEYLMAWYMLERDYEKAKKCFDRYFPNFSYSHIPQHYAEFLLLYKRLNNLDDSFFEKYPVSNELRENFDIMDTLLQSNREKMILGTMKHQFENTYWFYVRFPLVKVQKAQKDEKNIY